MRNADLDLPPPADIRVRGDRGVTIEHRGPQRAIGAGTDKETRTRYVCRLTDWQDDKGYGFVVPHDGGERAFVHIRAFERPGRRPAVGDLVAYAVARDARGRRNAAQVRLAGAIPIPKRATRDASPARMMVPRKSLALAAFAALGFAAWHGALPFAVVGWYAVASLVTAWPARGTSRLRSAGRGARASVRCTPSRCSVAGLARCWRRTCSGTRPASRHSCSPSG